MFPVAIDDLPLRFSWRLRKQVWRSCHVKNSTGHPKIRIPNIPNWSDKGISSGGFEGEKVTPPCCGIFNLIEGGPLPMINGLITPFWWPYKWLRGVITLLIGSSKSWTMLQLLIFRPMVATFFCQNLRHQIEGIQVFTQKLMIITGLAGRKSSNFLGQS